MISIIDSFMFINLLLLKSQISKYITLKFIYFLVHILAKLHDIQVR